TSVKGGSDAVVGAGFKRRDDVLGIVCPDDHDKAVVGERAQGAHEESNVADSAVQDDNVSAFPFRTGDNAVLVALQGNVVPSRVDASRQRQADGDVSTRHENSQS